GHQRRQPAHRPLGALVAALLLLAGLLVLAGPLVATLTRFPAHLAGARLAPALALAQSALAAARGRAAWAAGAVGTAVALAVAMGTMVGSFRTNVVAWTQETLRADLSLRPLASAAGATAGELPPELADLVGALVGAENVDAYHECAATLAGESVLLGGGEFAVLARAGGVPFLDGRDSRVVFAEALARGGALVNEPAARRFNLARGSSVRVETARGGLEREVIGVYRDFSGHLGRVVLDNRDYLRIAPPHGPESIGVFLPAGSDLGAARARIERELLPRFALEVRDNTQVRAEVLRVFERTFAVTIGLQALASLVAALAVVLVLSALVRERERDLAIVRVLGGSRRQLFTAVAAQALLLGTAGALSGLLFGLLVGYLLVTVVNVQSFGWSLDFAPPTSVLLTAASVLPCCLVAGLVPAWLSLRLQPQEVLREGD
ncbi:MAG: ABC transporter permease, partial [Planctomycetota bacterium]